MNLEQNNLIPAYGAHVPGPRHHDAEYVYYEAEDAEGPSFNHRAVLAALNRNKYIIIALVAAGLAVGLIQALMTKPIYRATASVQADQKVPTVVAGQEAMELPSAQGDTERFLATQAEILKSRSLAQKVAEDVSDHPAAFAAAGVQEGATPESLKGALTGLVQGNLVLDMPRASSVIKIGFDSTSPAFSAAVANAYVDNYVTGNLQRRFDTSAYSREFLQGQLQQTKRRLEDSERQLIAYARSAGIVNATGGSSDADAAAGSTTNANLAQLNSAYASARAARVAAQQRWEQASSTPLMSLPEVLSNPTITSLRQTKAQLEAEYEQERQRRREEHPALQQMAARISELDRQMADMANSVRRSIRDQYTLAVRQEQALRGNVNQLQGESLNQQDRGVRHNILKREVDTNRQLYESLLQRYREVSSAAGITSNNISVIDRAVPSFFPIWPKPFRAGVMGALGGLALAFLFVFVRERFDDTIRAPEDVDSKLGLAALGVVPMLENGKVAIEELADPRSAMSEAYQSLRTSIELSAVGGLGHSVFVTSSRAAEGKSTTSVAVALSFAELGKRVLLVDADLRKPSMHKLLGLGNDQGLSDVLTKRRKLTDCVQQAGDGLIHVLPSGPLPPNPAVLLGGNAFEELLAQAKSSFDLVIVDGPPVIGLADAPRLANVADGTLFVLQANGAHRGQAKAALKRLSAVGARIHGVVLTKFDARKAGYGDYGYYYYDYGNEKRPQVRHLEAA